MNSKVALWSQKWVWKIIFVTQFKNLWTCTTLNMGRSLTHDLNDYVASISNHSNFFGFLLQFSCALIDDKKINIEFITIDLKRISL